MLKRFVLAFLAFIGLIVPAALSVGATPGAALAGRFIDFVASQAGQKIIREYGGGLYNDAAYAKQYDD